MQHWFLFVVISALISCKKESPKVVAERVEEKICTVDSVAIVGFFVKYPALSEYQTDVFEVYKSRSSCIWFDGDTPVEYAHVLYDRLLTIADEGLPADIPYRAKLDQIFDGNSDVRPQPESELLLSALYFYYTCNVYGGLDPEKSRATGWFLPRAKVSYVSHLDSLLKKKDRGTPEFFGQYYNLRKALKKYRDIEKNGGWKLLETLEADKKIIPGDSAKIIKDVRTRLFVEGYLSKDSQSPVYDKSLLSAIEKYNLANVRNHEDAISAKLIDQLNVPVSDRIRTISLNMERCRWIDPELSNAKEYVAVNIPSFRLHYFRDGNPFFTSRVVVGKQLNATVVFSGEISYLAFAPYWNVPRSILIKEILPAIKRDPNYLSKNNMEWKGEIVRQRPGKDNALGLVKFMFPNSNNIYLHDTPAKSLFSREGRAFSHGCIRVERARELAYEITSKDGNWTMDDVDRAMNSPSENIYRLKTKIPVYIAYFTAWADKDGNCAFFDDVYQRDQNLGELLFKSTK